jgi:hypothetical protein
MYVPPALTFNPLNTELNPICHLLTLLGDHHIFYISRVRVKHFTFYSESVFMDFLKLRVGSKSTVFPYNFINT